MNLFAEKLGINIDLYAALVLWGLIFTRVFVMLILTPFLGGRGVPGRVRFLLGAVLALYVYYCFYGTAPAHLPEDKGLIIALFFKEIFIGLALGMTTVMCFYAIEAGGRIVDSQRGSANAQIFLPALGQVSVFGLFQYWVGLAVFCATGGHIIFLGAFLESYQIIPVMTLPKIAPGFSPFLEIMIRMSADVLVLGMQMAAPVLIGVFLTDLVLGIANKVAPQIPVFEIGFMMKGYIGVAMVYVSLMVVVGQMEEFFNVMQDNVKRVILYFGA